MFAIVLVAFCLFVVLFVFGQRNTNGYKMGSFNFKINFIRQKVILATAEKRLSILK